MPENKIQVYKPFGPSIAKVIIPEDLIKKLNESVDKIILDKNKIYHKFNWQVEKYTLDGALKDCWLTTMVSNPISLGSSI